MFPACLFIFICLYLYKIRIKIITSLYPLMKTAQLPDKNPTQLKGAYISRDQSFSSMRYNSCSERL